MEEILRRHVNEGEKLVADNKLPDLLFKDHETFVKNLYARREKEIVALHEVKPEKVEETFEVYDAQVRKIKAEFGYDVVIEEKKEEEKDGSGQDGPAAAEEAVDFAKAVTAALAKFPWRNAQYKRVIDHCTTAFVKYHQGFIMVANSLLGRTEENKIVGLREVPFINEAEYPDELLLAIIL